MCGTSQKVYCLIVVPDKRWGQFESKNSQVKEKREKFHEKKKRQCVWKLNGALLVGLLAGWLACWPAGWLAGRLAGSLCLIVQR